MAVLTRKEKLQQETSKGMARSAEQRKCPKCGRKGAIKRQIVDEGTATLRTCRWCDYEQFDYIQK